MQRVNDRQRSPTHWIAIAKMLRKLSRRRRRAPIAVEVGTYKGDTAEHCLTRFPSLTWIMVDSWTEADQDSAYARSRDFHALMPQAQHDENYAATVARTLKFGDRAKIYRMTSLKAAKALRRAKLDFV